MSTYVYIRSEPGLWTVGHYGDDGKWHPESDHGNPGEAADRVAKLNGGSAAEPAPVLPELDRECPGCEGSGEEITPQWSAWADRVDAASAAWRASHPGESWEASAERAALMEAEPAQDRTDCADCAGKGRKLTDAGRALLAFLQRHPPALTQVQT